MALLHSSIQSETSQQAFISGTEGSILIDKQCWRPQKLTLKKLNSQKEEFIEMPFEVTDSTMKLNILESCILKIKRKHNHALG